VFLGAKIHREHNFKPKNSQRTQFLIQKFTGNPILNLKIPREHNFKPKNSQETQFLIQNIRKPQF
jgi:hypothetical protein